MRSRDLFSVVLLTMVLMINASCGGSGGGSAGGSAETTGSMTITVDANTTTYAVGPINAYGYYDPAMEAGVYQDSGRTIIMMSSGVTGTSTPATLINILTSGHAPGSYPITGTGSSGLGTDTYISYRDHGQLHSSIISSGTVTITNIGNVGDPVIGSFSAVVLCTSPSHTHALSGTFNVIREN